MLKIMRREINFPKMRILNLSKWYIKIYGYFDLKRKLFKLPKNNWFYAEIKEWTFTVCYSNFGPYMNLEICCQINLNVCYSNVCPYINSRQTYVTEKFFILSLYFHISQSVRVQFWLLIVHFWFSFFSTINIFHLVYLKKLCIHCFFLILRGSNSLPLLFLLSL